MDILEKIKNEISAFDEKKQQLLNELKKEFAPMLAPLFEKHQQVKTISWTQYTPYFNDGEECIFGVHLDMDYGFKINGENEDDSEKLDWRIKYYLSGDAKYANLLQEKPNVDIELYKAGVEFQSAMGAIPKDFLKDLFGDHVEVTISSDGNVTTEQYKHD